MFKKAMCNYSCDDVSDLAEQTAAILTRISVARPLPAIGDDWELQRVQGQNLLLSIVV